MTNIHQTGRRKTSVARIYLKEGSGKVTVNGKKLEQYFGYEISQNLINKPFELTETTGKYDLKINVRGGGLTGQSQAASLAISKALVEQYPDYRKVLKDEGLLMRDPRMVERKKFGKKKARKSYQFSKR